MPRNISFALTTQQFRDRTKTVTRRLRWLKLKPGEVLCGCVKCMGLKPGESIERMGLIRVTSVRREPLSAMSKTCYGDQEAILEGFPHLTGHGFVTMFSENMRCSVGEIVTRIEYEYLDSVEGAAP